MAEERLLDPNKEIDDDTNELSLRPQKLTEYIF